MVRKISLSDLKNFVALAEKKGKKEININEIMELFEKPKKIEIEIEKDLEAKFYSDFGKTFWDFIEGYNKSFEGDESWKPNNWFSQRFDAENMSYDELKDLIWQNYNHDLVRTWVLKKQIEDI